MTIKNPFVRRRETVSELKELVGQAWNEGIRDAKARRCVLIHEWGKWEPLSGQEYQWQTRRCLRCGKFQDKRR